MKINLSEELIHEIRQVTGLRVTEFDHVKLHAWLEGRVNTLGLESSNGYLAYLRSAKDLSQDREMLSELLTTGETFFMRDSAQMELIRRVILPQLIAKNQSKKQLRIWAPACATGEEIYSLVILLEQALPNINEWKIDMIGSDINPHFIERAKIAIYKDWSFRGCSPAFKNHFFSKLGDGLKLIDRIRKRARFMVLDLMSGELPNFSNYLFDIDFILCRNIFIYMNTESISAITDKLSACLAPGGVLMTAHGELHAYRKSGLTTKIYPESLVYEKGYELSEDNLRDAFTTINSPSSDKALTQDTTSFNYFNKAIAPVSPTLSIHDLMDRAWYLADRGRFDDALRIYSVMLAKDPMQAELHYLHAVISLEKGDPDQAKEDLRKSLYIDSAFMPAYLELMTVYIKDGKTELAIKCCEQALQVLLKVPEGMIHYAQISSNPTDLQSFLVNLHKELTSQLQ